MSKRYNPNKCKINRNYSISEIAILFGIHKSTVIAWLKRGLKKIDKQRPFLVLGRDLKQFLKQQRVMNKRPCELGEIYCLKCRTPRIPDQHSISIDIKSSHYGCLKGNCIVCNSAMNKYFKLSESSQLQRHFAVILPLQQKRLG